jgi:hypothetical protein
MAYRFTDTTKWEDGWFSELKPLTKLLFLYLCDRCDAGGFLEVNIKKIAFDLGIGKQEAESGMEGLKSKIIFSQDSKYIFIRNFIKHQKNMPLNANNPAHRGIIKILSSQLQNFGLDNVNDFFSTASKPLASPSQGASKPLASPIGNIYNNINNIISIDNIDSNILPKPLASPFEAPLKPLCDFATFWELYDKKVGDKRKLVSKWEKLRESERLAILDYIPKYKLAQPDKRYRKNPETFLNNRGWEDELISTAAVQTAAPAKKSRVTQNAETLKVLLKNIENEHGNSDY